MVLSAIMNKNKITTEKQALAVVYWGKDDAFKYVPKKCKTPEVCLAAIQRNAGLLKYVPETMKTPEICLTAVRQWDLPLEYVPEPLKTKELCLVAIQNSINDRVINFIPSRYFEDAEFCFEAVRRHGPALERVPERFKTTELCFIAIQQSGQALKYVPDALKTVDLCNLAINNYESALLFVPESLKTKELCLLALSSSGWAIDDIPSKLFEDFEFCYVAVEKYAASLQYVPEKNKTAELCRFAVQKSGDVLKYVPEALKTAELCSIAVKNGIDVLEYVPEALKTTELCINTLKSEDHGLASISCRNQHIPAEQFNNESFCLALAEYEGSALKYIPEALRTREICLAAVKQDGRALKYVPEALKTKELCIEAAEQIDDLSFMGKTRDNVLEYVPEELKTTELCLIAIQQNRCALKHVPYSLINDKFYLDAIKQNCEVFIDIPEGQKTEELCLTAAAGFGNMYYYDHEWMKKFFTLVPDKYVKSVKEIMRNTFFSENKDLYTKKEAHFFLSPKIKISDFRSPLHMFFEAKCKARGISDSDSKIISRVFADKFNKNYNHKIVVGFLDMIARQKDYLINENELNDICEFIDSEIIKSNESLDKTVSFSLKGRTISSVMFLSNDWHNQRQTEQLLRFSLNDDEIIASEWQGIPVKNYKQENKNYLWNIKQLCSIKELVNEGRTMKHCAASYAHRCSKGETALFHVSGQKMNCQKKSILNATVELLATSRSIVQVKGKCNENPDIITLNIIKEWAQENNLKICIDLKTK